MLIIDERTQNEIDNILPGWRGLVKDLISALNKFDAEIHTSQIKEKYGGLRFYISIVDEDETVSEEIKTMIYNKINFYEEMSYYLCCECGRYRVGRDGYYQYCNEHMPSPKRSGW